MFKSGQTHSGERTGLAGWITFGFLFLFTVPGKAQVEIISPNPSGFWGEKLSTIKDVNGDGYSDIIIGADTEEIDVLNEGIVYLYDAVKGEQIREITSPNSQIDGLFGNAVSTIGDIDGDGIDDVVVGAQWEDIDVTDEPDDNQGRVYVMSGADGSELITLKSPNPEINGRFGTSVKGVQDFNDDGVPDILAGAPHENQDAEYPGRAYLFSGDDGSLLFTFESPNPRENASTSAEGFGFSLTDIDDINQDDIPEIVIGAWREDNPDAVGTARDGQVYIYSGATGELSQTISSPNTEANGSFGYSLETVADMTGDGRQDLLVGAKDEDVPNDDDIREQGRVYLVSGASGEVVQTYNSPFKHDSYGFGRTIKAFQDFNGDGVPDFLVGLTSAGEGGRVFIISGGNGEILKEISSPNEEFGGAFGFAVDVADDMSDTGVRDLVISAPGESRAAFSFNTGRVYILENEESVESDEAAPPPPTNLAANTENEQIELSWLASDAADLSHYNIYRTTDRFELDSLAGPDSQFYLESVTNSITSYVDGGAEVETTYYYRVTAEDDAGNESAYSNRVDAAWERDELTNSEDVIRAVESPNSMNNDNFGEVVKELDDVNGDGVPEFLVTASGEEVDGEDSAGRVYLFDGSTGQEVYSVVSPNVESTAYFGGGLTLTALPLVRGQSVAEIDDLDGDGIMDFAVGAPRENLNTGKVYLFSGKDGTFLHSLDPPGEVNFQFGFSVSAVGDLSGNGTRDIVVSAPIQELDGYYQNGLVHAYDAVSGDLLYSVHSPDPEDGGAFGFSISGLEDVNNDGVDDFAVGAPLETSHFSDDYNVSRDGVVHFVSGADGEVLQSIESPESDDVRFTNGSNFGITLKQVSDMNEDGRPDLLVGDNAIGNFVLPNGEKGTVGGMVHLLDGNDGSLIRNFWMQDAASPDSYGSNMVELGDVNGDDIPDFAISAPRRDTGAENDHFEGRVDIVSGKDGSLLKILTSPNEEISVFFGMALSGGGDYNGDGIPDVIATSFEELYPEAEESYRNTGRVFVLSGEPEYDPDSDSDSTDVAMKTIFAENFDVTEFPDDRWTLYSENESATWHLGNPDVSFSSIDDQNLNSMMVEPATEQFESLYSSPISIQDSAAVVSFWLYQETPDNYSFEKATLAVGLGNQGTTDYFWDNYINGEGLTAGWQEITLKLNEFDFIESYTGDDIQLAFLYSGSDGGMIAIDSIRVMVPDSSGSDDVDTSLDEQLDGANTYSLSQNYPNPFNPSTTITFELPKISKVKIEVFDMLGRKVSTLLNTRKKAGMHSVTFDASSLSSGMYIYRIQAGDFTKTRKLTLIK